MIALHGVCRRYGEREALSDVSLTVQEGQTLVVFGPNGAGKTTLLRILATLLRPHDGTVEVLGKRLPAEGWAVRGRIGFLGHEPLLYRELSAEENLRYHARLHGVEGRRIAEVLEAVGMDGRAREPVKTLSRGMVQRVAIARTVLHKPELLLLDEPYANLDPGAKSLMTGLIGPDSGCTRVICSHNADEGRLEGQVVLGLRNGRSVFLGAIDEINAAQIKGLYR